MTRMSRDDVVLRKDIERVWKVQSSATIPVATAHGGLRTRSQLRWIVACCLAGAVPGPARGALALETPQEKPGIVISMAVMSPDTAYARRYTEWLERRPFDGVALAINPLDSGLPEFRGFKRPRENGSLCFGHQWGMASLRNTSPWNKDVNYTPEMIAPAVADLRATRFATFKQNFILTLTRSMAAVDWFNDAEWAQRCHNFAMLARLARQGGCKGIMFDEEEAYDPNFDFDALRKRNAFPGKRWEEVRDKARQRGREFAAAIGKEFPDIVFWPLHGYSTNASLIEQGLPEYSRRLSPAFFDGMLEGSAENFVFVDGGEGAYGYNLKEHFEFGRQLAKELPIRMGLTQVPELHRKKVRCGFGLWPDYYDQLDADTPENSYFSPGRFQRAVYWALTIGDGYVWLWGEKWTWWMEGTDDHRWINFDNVLPKHLENQRGLPFGYWKALEAGRTSPGGDISPVRGTTTGLPQRGRNYCTDGKPLQELLKQTEKVFELPREGWTFKLDDLGSESDDPKTFDKPIAIGKTWAEQGFKGPDTIGWYRLEFQLPETLKGRTLHFYFPDVDGSVWMSSRSCPRPQTVAWRYIGLEPEANRQPFTLGNQLSAYFFVPGGPATVVIKVQGHNGTGGILAPIQVLAVR